jgi:4-amino-4-deoxy-L-arabinose transferase-like glycosyltransferase
MRALVAVVFFAAAAFCAYGFVAAGEPGPENVYFRIGYPIAGIACLAMGVGALMPGRTP